MDVVRDVAEAGFPMQPEWFAPHFEFRFPQHGDTQLRNIQLELRHALEPWHVLGEEGAGGGAVRYVDSSVERVQVKAQGLVDSRHVITCNGTPVPLHTTGTQGEYVAGVRYRAWQPPNCLHPTIPVHAPLVFDVVDTRVFGDVPRVLLDVEVHEVLLRLEEVVGDVRPRARPGT